MIFEDLGNVPLGYEHQHRVVHRIGLRIYPSITDPALVLKHYEMHELGTRLETSLIHTSDEFLFREIQEGRIKPLIGLGFSILSGGMLNVAIWKDTQYPFVPRNQLYKISPEGFKTLDIREEGAFCAYELGIAAHEGDAWLKYLQSPRLEADKVTYLDSFIEGNLDPLSKSVLDIPISKLNLNIRTRNVFNELRIKTIGDIVRRTKKELLCCKNFGEVSSHELERELERYGLHIEKK